MGIWSSGKRHLCQGSGDRVRRFDGGVQLPSNLGGGEDAADLRVPGRLALRDQCVLTAGFL